MVERQEVETGVCDCRTDMCCAVGVSQGLLQHDAVAGVGLDREGKEPIRGEHAGGSSGDRAEIAGIDEYVGCDDNVILRLRLRIGVKEMQQVEDGQSVIKAL